MSSPRCGVCARPTDAYLCHRCARDIRDELHALTHNPPDRPGRLLDALDDVLTRAVKIDAHGGEPATLPIGYAATQAAVTLRSTLVAWIRSAAAAHGYHVAIQATLPDMARWLTTHATWLRACPDAAQAHDELLYAVDVVRRTIDRPPRLWFAGHCTHCEHDLYGVADEQTGRPLDGQITCPHCRTVYTSRDRQHWLLEAARDMICTTSVISQALSRWSDRDVTPAMIRKYAHSGYLHRVDYNTAGQPRYRLGDVIDCVIAAAARRPPHDTRPHTPDTPHKPAHLPTR